MRILIKATELFWWPQMKMVTFNLFLSARCPSLSFRTHRLERMLSYTMEIFWAFTLKTTENRTHSKRKQQQKAKPFSSKAIWHLYNSSPSDSWLEIFFSARSTFSLFNLLMRHTARFFSAKNKNENIHYMEPWATSLPLAWLNEKEASETETKLTEAIDRTEHSSMVSWVGFYRL